MSSGSNSAVSVSDATYRRLRLDPPAQCIAHAQKAANIGRHIQALEETHRELMSIQDRLNFANKAYTFARIVKDTSVAFLDLAGAIAGGQAATVGSVGVAAIDTATSVSEVAHGQGDAATIALRTANSANSVLKGPGAGGTFGQMSGQQTIGMAQTVNEMRSAPSAGAAQQKAAQGAVNLMADTVKGVADMASTSESDKFGKAGRVAAIIKAAYGYKAALNDTIEQRLQTEYDIASAKAVYLHNNRLIMERYRKDLREAMDLLNQCQGQ
ncbi:hypothetical protein [Paracoccus sulfuroxidans]|uniref:Uncharacterized protein n=1 Tax=Paracoccus sulfuroxidans TaxID=384678 RepID=A0A562NCK5_9RHOB|nr:hypothetical protein [Paracoccus sulfuroxidans]TWI29905.1 hypothetical protein IQ24_03377 [Paracoccus sulfuroxidans]